MCRSAGRVKRFITSLRGRRLPRAVSRRPSIEANLQTFPVRGDHLTSARRTRSPGTWRLPTESFARPVVPHFGSNWVEQSDDGLEALTALSVGARSQVTRGPQPIPSATAPVVRQGPLAWWDRALMRLRGNGRSRRDHAGAAVRSHAARARAECLLRAEQIDLQVEAFNACRPRTLTWLERPHLTADLAESQFDREWPLAAAHQPTAQGG